MLIDFHTHAFPDAVAGRALAHLSQAGGALRPRTDGTVAGLTQALEQADALGCCCRWPPIPSSSSP